MVAAVKYREYVVFSFLLCPEMLLEPTLFELFRRVGSRALVIQVFRNVTLSFHPEFETIGAQNLSWKVLGKEKSQKALRHVAKTAVLTAGLVMRQRRAFILAELEAINALLRIEPGLVAPKLPQILAALAFANAELVAFFCHTDVGKDNIRRDTRKHLHPNRYLGTDVAALLSHVCELLARVRAQEDSGHVRRYYAEQLVANDLRALQVRDRVPPAQRRRGCHPPPARTHFPHTGPPKALSDRCCERVPSIGSFLDATLAHLVNFQADLDGNFDLRGAAGDGASTTPSTATPLRSKRMSSASAYSGGYTDKGNPFDAEPLDADAERPSQPYRTYFRAAELHHTNTNLSGVRAGWETLVSLAMSPAVLSSGFGIIPAGELQSPPFRALFDRMLDVYDRTCYVDSLSSVLLRTFAIPHELWWFTEAFAKSYREAIDGVCNPLIDVEAFPTGGTGLSAPLATPLIADDSARHSLAFFHVLSYNWLNVHDDGPPSEDSLIAIATVEVCDAMVDDWVGYFVAKTEALVAAVRLLEQQTAAVAAAARLASLWGYDDGAGARKNSFFGFRRPKSAHHASFHLPHHGHGPAAAAESFADLPGSESARAPAAEKSIEELILLKRCIAGLVAAVSSGGAWAAAAGPGVVALYHRRYDLTSMLKQRLVSLFEESVRSLLHVAAGPGAGPSARQHSSNHVLALGAGPGVAGFSDRLFAVEAFCCAAQFVMDLFPTTDADAAASSSSSASSSSDSMSTPVARGSTKSALTPGTGGSFSTAASSSAGPVAWGAPSFTFHHAFRAAVLRQYTLSAAVPSLAATLDALGCGGGAGAGAGGAGGAGSSASGTSYPGSPGAGTGTLQVRLINEITAFFRQAITHRSAFVWLPHTREFCPLPKAAQLAAAGATALGGMASLFAGGGGSAKGGSQPGAFPLGHRDLVALCRAVGPPGVRVIDDEVQKLVGELSEHMYAFVVANKAVLADMLGDFRRGAALNPMPYVSSLPLMTASVAPEASASSGTAAGPSVMAAAAGHAAVAPAAGYTDKLSVDALTATAATGAAAPATFASRLRGLADFTDALVALGVALAARDCLHAALEEALDAQSPGLGADVRRAEDALRAAGVDVKSARGATAAYGALPECVDVVLAATVLAAASTAAASSASGSLDAHANNSNSTSASASARSTSAKPQDLLEDFAQLFPVAAAATFLAPRWEDCVYFHELGAFEGNEHCAALATARLLTCVHVVRPSLSFEVGQQQLRGGRGGPAAATTTPSLNPFGGGPSSDGKANPFSDSRPRPSAASVAALHAGADTYLTLSAQLLLCLRLREGRRDKAGFLGGAAATAGDRSNRPLRAMAATLSLFCRHCFGDGTAASHSGATAPGAPTAVADLRPARVDQLLPAALLFSDREDMAHGKLFAKNALAYFHQSAATVTPVKAAATATVTG